MIRNIVVAPHFKREISNVCLRLQGRGGQVSYFIIRHRYSFPVAPYAFGATDEDRTDYLNIVTIIISLRTKAVASGASPTSYHHQTCQPRIGFAIRKRWFLIFVYKDNLYKDGGVTKVVFFVTRFCSLQSTMIKGISYVFPQSHDLEWQVWSPSPFLYHLSMGHKLYI